MRGAHRLVGRQPDVQCFRAALDGLADGEGSVLLVQGEPGIGKTRLLDEAHQIMSDTLSPALVGRAAGVDLAGGAVPYGLVVDLLLDLIDHAPQNTQDAIPDIREPDRAPVAGDGWYELAEVLPMIQGPSSGPAAPVDRLRVFAAVRQFLDRLLRQRPVVLLVDDLQWADSASVDLLTYLLEALRRRPLVAMLAFRPLSGGDAPPALAQLVRSTAAEMLLLGPLSAEDVADQLRQLTGDEELPAQQIAKVVELSGGIPLYVEELAASRAGEPVPARLELMLVHRLAGCTEAVRLALGVAALSPRPFDAAALAEVTGLARADVLHALHDGAARGLLEEVEAGSFKFHHVLLQHAVAHNCPLDQRQQGHRAWARWVEAFDEDGGTAHLSLAAYHWYHSGDAEEALPAVVRAASEAHRLGGLAEAATHWRNLLSLWPRIRHPSQLAGMDRDNVVVMLDEAYNFSGRWEANRELLDAEEQRRESDWIKRLWIRLRRERVHECLGLPSQPAARPAELEAVLTDLERMAATTSSRMLANCLIMLGDDDPTAPLDFHLRRMNAIQEVAKRLDDRRLHAMGLFGTAYPLRRTGDVTGALEAAREAVRLVEDISPVDADWFRTEVIDYLTDLGRIREAVLEGERALADGVGAVTDGTKTYTALATTWAYVIAGELDRARELGRRLLLHPSDYERALAACTLATVELSQGNLELTHALLADGDALAVTGGHLADARRAVRGWLHQCRGEVPSAREVLQPALTTVETYPKWVILMVATRRADTAPPTQWTQDLETAARRLPNQGTVAAATRAQVAAHLTSLTDPERSNRWAQAAKQWAEVPYREAEAWCRLRCAQALLDERHFEDAERELATVLRIAALLSNELLKNEASSLARRARLPLGEHRPQTAPDTALTAREQEVLTLVAHGKTNQEIATELFMSPKTASVHISRILHKLGAANRTEAAWHAHQLGLD